MIREINMNNITDFSYLKPLEEYIPSIKENGVEITFPAYSNPFIRDIEQILNHSSFRRLAGKTQIFSTNKHDHTRNRLTHSLLVSQIARTITNTLGLNVNLAEAIALGHDLGHTPFGHIGERVLNQYSNNCFEKKAGFYIHNNFKGFKHNYNSARILIEAKDISFTNYTLFGVLNHTDIKISDPCSMYSSKTCKLLEPIFSDNNCNNGVFSLNYYEIFKKMWSVKDNGDLRDAWSFEAYIVKWADDIAQRQHDIEDALLMELVEPLEVVNNLNDLYKIHTKFIEIYGFSNTIDSLQNLETLAKEDKQKRFKVNQLNIGRLHTKISNFVMNLYITCLISAFKEILDNFTINSLGIKQVNEKSIDLARRKFSDEFFNYKSSDINSMMMNLSYFKEIKKPIHLSDFLNANINLHNYINNMVVKSNKVQRMDGKAKYIIRKIMNAYLSNPQQLPDNVIVEAFNFMDRVISNEEVLIEEDTIYIKKADYEKWKEKEIGFESYVYKYRNILNNQNLDSPYKKLLQTGLLRAAINHVANMTDRYAQEEYKQLYS